MNNFVKGLIQDLLNRIYILETKLIEPNLLKDKAISFVFLNDGKDQLENLKVKVQKLLNRDDLMIPDQGITNSFLKLYHKHKESYISIEQDFLLPIFYYSENESYFSKLLQRIYEDIRLRIDYPMVTCFTKNEDYYWAKPPHLIGVPSSEKGNLLNMADLYHEIVHHILYAYDKDGERFISGDIRAFIIEYFDEELFKAKNKPQLIANLNNWKDNWLEIENNWLEEFICDMIATYFVGSAYAWTHTKLTFDEKKEDSLGQVRYSAYDTTKNHPADEARMRAIKHMLYLLGEGENLIKISSVWNVYVETHEKVDYYDWAYPDILFEKLANILWNSCKGYRFKDYVEQIKSDKITISEQVNLAWKKFNQGDEDFFEWQKAITADL